MIRIQGLIDLPAAVSPGGAALPIKSLGSESNDGAMRVVIAMSGKNPILALLHVTTNTVTTFDHNQLGARTFTSTPYNGIDLIYTYAEMLERGVTAQQYWEQMQRLIASGVKPDDEGNSPLVRMTVDGMLSGLIRQSALIFLHYGIVGGDALIDTLLAGRQTVAASPLAQVMGKSLNLVDEAVTVWTSFEPHELTDEHRQLMARAIATLAMCLTMLPDRDEDPSD